MRAKSVVLMICAVAAVILATGGTTARAEVMQMVLSPSSVIGGEGGFDGDGGRKAYNVAYGDGVLNIVDSQTPGTKHENTSPTGGRWIAPQDGISGWDSWVVLDLGASYVIDHIVLYNTHNYSWNDRGTSGFTVLASNAVQDAGTYAGVPVGMNVVGATTLLTGTLTWSSSDNIVGQSFDVSNENAYRYLRINVDAYSGLPPWRTPGLNEVMVFGTPEPATLTLLALGGLAVMRRRRP